MVASTFRLLHALLEFAVNDHRVAVKPRSRHLAAQTSATGTSGSHASRRRPLRARSAFTFSFPSRRVRVYGPRTRRSGRSRSASRIRRSDADVADELNA
jgi:hypothetical protein